MSIPVISEEKCTGCEDCVDACPTEAIAMANGIAVIDPGICSECLACIDVCSSQAISEP